MKKKIITKKIVKNKFFKSLVIIIHLKYFQIFKKKNYKLTQMIHQLTSNFLYNNLIYFKPNLREFLIKEIS